MTRRLPGGARRTQAPRPGRPAPPREQIAALIQALGDTEHPQHASAVDELVAIGAPAVPALCEALGRGQPWLSVYRAAEAAGLIGDGRATGPLLQALGHPNSNVRWSAVRALTQIGDVRALIDLRRVAQQDQGRTSWGEPLAGAAQSALGEISRRSIWGQSIELVKTAVTAALMILALILAFSVVATVREELDRYGRIIPGQTELPQFTLPTAAPTAGVARPTAAPLPTAVLAPVTEPSPAEPAAPITGTVLQSANVRPQPDTSNEPVGLVAPGDELILLASSADGLWVLVRLGEVRANTSQINSADGTGWINRALLGQVDAELPVQQPGATPEATPSP